MVVSGTPRGCVCSERENHTIGSGKVQLRFTTCPQSAFSVKLHVTITHSTECVHPGENYMTKYCV